MVSAKQAFDMTTEARDAFAKSEAYAQALDKLEKIITAAARSGVRKWVGYLTDLHPSLTEGLAVPLQFYMYELGYKFSIDNNLDSAGYPRFACEW